MFSQMNQATRVFSNRIAVVFDFDKTLTPEDSFESLLRDLQIDVDEFQANYIQPLVDEGWEKYLARAYCLVAESHRRRDKITKNRLAQLGSKLPLYSGTQELFDGLRKTVEEINQNIELEFYLISGGLVDIARNTSLAKNFTYMWGCELHYDNTGEVAWMKKQMTHTEKTRYLYYLSKGIDTENEKDLMYNYASIPPRELRIPLDQIIYIGDGSSDIPCFTVMKQYGGVSIGIYPEDSTAQEWKYLQTISANQRLSNLVPARYEQDSQLMRSLLLGVEYMAKRITLLQMSIGK